MALRLMADKIFARCAKAYQGAVARELTKTGLRYEDLLNESEPDVAEALALASPEVQIARTRRLKRALDLNLKQKNFMDYAPDVEQETFKQEIFPDLLKIRARDQEFALLNMHKN